jgi:hypothetical protein
MRKITDYRILTETITGACSDLDVRLKDEVPRLIKEGWQPFGSLTCFTEQNKGTTFYAKLLQIMVKYEA